ncbi:MAG: IS4 family transposase [Polyangiaceae bacterium]
MMVSLEGLHGFSNNHVDADAILAPHIEATQRRARLRTVLMVHDTTEFVFGGRGERAGLGPVRGGDQRGFLGHFALAVARGEERLPLGVAGLLRIARKERTATRPRSTQELAKLPERESLRWGTLVSEVEERRQGFECIHVMDREGDAYELLALMQEVKARFIVRAAYNRALAEDGKLLHHTLEELFPMAQRSIELSVRPPNGPPDSRANRKHPPRSQRQATVAVSSARVTLRRPHHVRVSQREITLNVVHVWEPAPAAGESAVEWTLYTTEPVDTDVQVWAVVDSYRARWVIEELFKALKTGCNIERRQLETFHSLSNALSIFIPVACRMLLARALCRACPTAPSAQLLSPIQHQLLTHQLRLTTVPATIEQALYAVAKLGGHLRRNGPPGWQTLAKGFEALMWMQAGWHAAHHPGSDQS